MPIGAVTVVEVMGPIVPATAGDAMFASFVISIVFASASRSHVLSFVVRSRSRLLRFAVDGL